MIRAVIYDMDGVLIDSEPLWKIAEIRTFERVGLHLTYEMCNLTMGYRTDETVNYWFQKQPWKGASPAEVLVDMLFEAKKEILENGKAMEGVKESLAFFQQSGLKIGLASSSTLDLIHSVVDKLQIRENFEVIRSAEHEKYGKPHPAVFLATAEALNVDPRECLVIEDSINGLIAAKAAKMKALAVPDQMFLGDKRLGIADLILPSLALFGHKEMDFFNTL